jgi:hypothetical protein
MNRWRPIRRLRRWVIAECARLLTKPLANYVQRVPNNIDKLKKTLRKGDVLLVEGDQRVSQVIRYLTQSSWSHCALYIGDELLHGDPQRAADLRERFGDDAQHLIIEAELGLGVCASPISKYERFNIRICRPQGLHRDDVAVLLGYVIARIGQRYDIRHIVELLRFFFPVSIVPRRWRNAALTFGSDRRHAVICSSLLGEAFARIGYPILPDVTISDAYLPPLAWWKRVVIRKEPRPLAKFRHHGAAFVTPRDFDLSPYFEVVKFNHLGAPRFDYREIVWDTPPAAAPQQTPPLVPAEALASTGLPRWRGRVRPALLGSASAVVGLLQRLRS